MWHDPYVKELRGLENLPRVPEVSSEVLSQADCVVITTDHSVYDWEAIVKNAKLIVDSRNATRGVGLGRHKIVPL
jgi:UDP-N-acetyl-D-glucosamine dehydrogenase